MKRTAFIVAVAMTSLLAARAEAAQLVFTFTGADTGSFVLNSNPTPAGVYSDSSSGTTDNPYFTNVSGTGPDQAAGLVFPYVTFYGDDDQGGVTVNGGSGPGESAPNYIDVQGLTATTGQIFSGTAAAPVFTTGVYNLQDVSNSEAVTLTVTSAAPEPAAWALMILGVGVVGASLRLGRRKPTLALA